MSATNSPMQGDANSAAAAGAWPETDREPVVSARHVNHHYGEGEARKQVLFDNLLKIGPGEIVIMTGPSGSGKTTLLTLIGGLRRLQEGTLRVLGHDLSRLGRKQLVRVRKGIGFIFQAHNLFESLTSYQNVRMALELKRQSASAIHARAVEILTTLGLEERLHYKPGSLSGGQRQRVAIGRALANRPQLVLADEPTAALDEKTGRDVVTLLQKLAREAGTTSLIVTHDNRILDVADRIVNMVDGHIRSNVLVRESIALCEFLSRCPAFSGLTPAQLASVAERMSRRRYAAQQVIFRQGDEGDRFYLIRRGAVDVLANEGTPQARLLVTQKAGEFFGEMALIRGEPRSATVVAREDVEVYTLDKADFQAALEQSPSFKEELYKIYFQRQ